MQSITPCLWFDTQALEAAEFYASIFPRSKVREVTHYTEAGPRPKGSVLTVQFELDGQEFIALNGGANYPFTPAISLSVSCKTQKEVDTFWKKLARGGKASVCGWLTDRYGLSWQIVPTALPKLIASKDAAKVTRVMKAMFGMTKLDIAALEKAAAEGTARGGAKGKKKEKSEKKKATKKKGSRG